MSFRSNAVPELVGVAHHLWLYLIQRSTISKNVNTKKLGSFEEGNDVEDLRATTRTAFLAVFTMASLHATTLHLLQFLILPCVISQTSRKENKNVLA